MKIKKHPSQDIRPRSPSAFERVSNLVTNPFGKCRMVHTAILPSLGFLCGECLLTELREGIGKYPTCFHEGSRIASLSPELPRLQAPEADVARPRS